MEFKRNSDARAIILGLAKESDPYSSFISAVNYYTENFLTSEFYNGVLLNYFNSDGTNPHSNRNYWNASPHHNHKTTHSTVEKIVGLQFADVQTTNVPNESTIAFGSAYYSNDEQKAFALKYDCTIAKSPSKTQYYFLNETEEKTIELLKHSKKRLDTKPHQYNRLYFGPLTVKDSIISYFDSQEFRDFLSQKLIRDRVWSKLVPSTTTPNSSSQQLLANGQVGTVNFTVLDALAYGYKYMFLQKYIYPGTTLQRVTARQSYGILGVPDLKYVNLDYVNYYERAAASYNNKNYEKTLINEAFLTDSEVADYIAGKDITINFPLYACNSWRFSFERAQPGYNYNQSTYIQPNEYLNVTSIPITINKSMPGLALVSQMTYGSDGDIDYLAVDRLVGFLSENPNIKLVSSSTFANQIKEDSPRLTINTYDSLFGMICSEDDNTRKTAVKMLQGFDIPTPSEPNALAGYVKDLAVDLIINSETKGASLNKWLVKYTGHNMNRQPRNFYRRSYRSYTNNPYEINSNSQITYKGSILDCNESFHPAMTYDERSLVRDKLSELEQSLTEYFAGSYKDMRKYFPHSSMNVPYFSSVASYVITKYEAERVLENPDKIVIDQCELYIRHYVNYFIDKAFLLMSAKIPFFLKFESPSDLQTFKPNSAYVNKHFNEYRTLITQAKAAAIKNPSLFMNLIKDAYSRYEIKYSLNANSWNRDKEFEFIVQSISMGDNIISYNKRANDHSNESSSFNYSTVLESLRMIAQLGIPSVTQVTANI